MPEPERLGWSPTRTRTEFRCNPVGITVRSPRLQWALPGDAAVERQAAFQVLVAQDRDRLTSSLADWDSGWVETDDATCEYPGGGAATGARFWWTVRVRAESGATSDWSTPGFWELGLLQFEEWDARWIRRSERGRKLPDRAVNAFRRGFRLDRLPLQARVYVSALGMYELVVNAERAGNALYRPGWTDVSRRVQFQVVDVLDALRIGENVVGALLAPGWFSGRIASRVATEDASHPDVKAPELLLRLECRFEDGTAIAVCSDERWQWAPWAISSSDLYDGEDWDRRLLRSTWASVQDVGPWSPVEIGTGSSGTLVGERCDPVRVTRRTVPEIAWRSDGTALVDSGRNDTGFLDLTVREEPGRLVEVEYGEILDPEGNLYRENLRGARCADRFICAGGGPEELAPKFSYRGYRYAQVTGLTSPSSLLKAEAVQVGSPMERIGWFRSSERLLEQLYELMVCSLEANYVDVPTDCPQRNERLGWMADALLFAPVASYTYDIAAFMSKWFDDVLDARTAAGGFADIAPRPTARWSERPSEGAPAWADAGVQLPWLMYERYGDREVLRRMYPAMLDWLKLVHEQNEDGIWRAGRGQDYGDWVPVGLDTSHALFATCWLYRSTKTAQRIAELLEDSESAAWLGRRANVVRNAFTSAYVDLQSGIVRDVNPRAESASARRFAPMMGEETQTAYVLALCFGLLDGDVARKAGARLGELVQRAGRRLETGFAGSAFLLSALEQAGFPGLAYDLLLRREMPSLGFMVERGATSVWERWDGLDAAGWPACPIMNSFNHYAMSSMLVWIVEGVCGLRPLPGGHGVQAVRFAPALSRRVHDAEFELQAPAGRLVLRWSWDGDRRVVGSVKVPPGMRCTLAGELSVDDVVGGAVAEEMGEQDADVGPGEYEVVWSVRP